MENASGFKARFTRKEIEKIMDEAAENDNSPKSSAEVFQKKWGKMHDAFMEYLDEDERHTFHWGYELGYTAGLMAGEKGGVA